MLEGRAAIERDFQQAGKWVDKNLRKFNYG